MCGLDELPQGPRLHPKRFPGVVVLLLRDVLSFSATETAELLDVSVPAANSALQRARATLARHRRPDEPRRPDPASSAAEQALLQRYMRAHEQADPAAIVAVLREDARLTISPMGLCWDGRDEITQPFLDNMGALETWRCFPTAANGQLAVANYLRRWDDDTYKAFTLVVLTVDGDALVEMATFATPELFAAFDLPRVL